MNHCTWNYSPSNLLFRFIDSYTWMQKIIAIMFQLLKTIKKWKLAENLKLLCPTHRKMAPCQFWSVIVKNSFYLADCFQLHKYQLFVFLNVHNIRKKQRSSGKFMLSKNLLDDKRPVGHAILSFSLFSILQHWHVFSQNNEFSKFYYVTNFYDLETFHIHSQKVRFVVYYFQISRFSNF